MSPRAAADYLAGSLHSHQANRSAWHRALEVLRTEPDSVLAEVTATPLGLWLVRTVYIKDDGDPDELTARPAEELPGVADLRASRSRRSFISTLGFGLVGGFVSGCAAGLAVGFAFGLVFGLVSGFAVGLAVWLMIWIFGWLETPSPPAKASSPQASLRSDRTLNLIRIICSCIVAGAVLGVVFGFVGGLVLGSVGGLVLGLVGGLMSALAAGRHRAWLVYLWATWRLSREGKLPRKLMPFLVDMHRLGLLRAVGRIYQFRHAELQDYLAEAFRRAG